MCPRAVRAHFARHILTTYYRRSLHFNYSCGAVCVRAVFLSERISRHIITTGVLTLFTAGVVQRARARFLLALSARISRHIRYQKTATRPPHAHGAHALGALLAR